MLSDQKNLNYVIEIVFTQYIFCWLQLLLKTGYFFCFTLFIVYTFVIIDKFFKVSS